MTIDHTVSVHSKRKTRRFLSLGMMTGKQPPKRVHGILAAAFSALMLSGCVSAVPEGQEAAELKPSVTAPDQAAADAAQQQHVNGQTGYVDPALVSAASARTANHATQNINPAAQDMQAQVAAQSGQPGYGASPQIGGLATQPTGISAGSQSIFSSAAAPVVAEGQMGLDTVPAYAPAQKIAPALNSVYSAPAMHAPAQAQPVSLQEQSSAVPAQQAPNAIASAVPATQHPSSIPQNMPIAAALFAGAPKKRSSNAAGLTQVAALPRTALQQQGNGLAGRTTMSDAFDESHIDEDDNKPTGLMKLASISGMTRVAPNGLVLQTNQVNVGCFKPELIRRIKEVEAHYKRPAIVTSGYRPPKGVTQGSKHYTCEAADIQIKGVTKWELADYLRSLPDRGGVGTYCHTESVHMDIGEPRDWNWRCRRTGTSS